MKNMPMNFKAIAILLCLFLLMPMPDAYAEIPSYGVQILNPQAIASSFQSTCFAGLASPIGVGNLSAGSEGQTIQTTGGNVVWGSAGAGSVTSIAQGLGITATPNPITGSGSIALNTSYTDSKYVNRSSWATIDNYPADCSAGKAVTGLGDTLTCNTFLTSYTETDPLWQGNYSSVAFKDVNNVSNSTIYAFGYSSVPSAWTVTNTTAQMLAAINNSGYLNITINSSNILNVPASWLADNVGANVSSTTCTGTQKVSAINNLTGAVTCSVDVDTDTWNTTSEMRAAVNNTYGTMNITINASNVQNPPWLTSYTETESRWQGNYSLVAFVSNLVGMLGNWSADKASYVTTTVFSSIGNWTADKASYATTTALTSVGNWTADRGNYINTTRSWTNDTNMGLSGTTLTWLGTLADGRIASASTWNGKAGTGACTANQFAIATTTGGVTCFQPVGANISSGTITTTQLATGTLNQANITNTVAACTNQFSRGMGPTTQNCATVGNGDMTSGAYASITGIGTQAQNLNMNNYNVTGVQCIVFNGGGTWCTA